MNSSLHLFLGQIFMALTLDINNMFLEVLNLSQIYPITSKVHFVKGLTNYIKYVLNIFSFCQISLFFFSITNPFLFELQSIIQEHEELLWLAGNLKLEVTNYLKDLYGLGGATYPGGGDDDDNDNDDDEEEDLKVTPSYQPRKRRHC